MGIDEYANIYFNLPEEKRDINTWCPILEYYVLKVCKTYRNLFTHDERYQLAWLGATKAIKAYDLTKKARFSIFAYVCMKNEILLERKRYFDKVSFTYGKPEEGTYTMISTSVKSGVDDDLELGDLLTTNYCVDDDGVANADIEIFTKNLSEMDKTIVEWLYNGRQQTELADHFGVSKTTIYRHVQKIKKMDKELLKIYGG